MTSPLSPIPDDRSDKLVIHWIDARGIAPHLTYIACFRYSSGAYREFDGHAWRVWPDGKEG